MKLDLQFLVTARMLLLKVPQNFHCMVISTSWICKIPTKFSLLHYMICFSFSFQTSAYFNGFQL